jgi:hypothetical protein
MPLTALVLFLALHNAKKSDIGHQRGSAASSVEDSVPTDVNP